MIVCVCNNISETELHDAIADGASTVGQLRKSTGLGTNCGGCVAIARSILESKLAEQLAANPDLFYAA